MRTIGGPKRRAAARSRPCSSRSWPERRCSSRPWATTTTRDVPIAAARPWSRARGCGSRPSATAGVALLDARGERTIVVQGERIVPIGQDDLPWDRLAEMDGIYFTGGDAASLRAARAARTSSRRHAPGCDDGQRRDARRARPQRRRPGRTGRSERRGWSARLTVATRGPDGGTYTTGDGHTGSFEAAPLPGPIVDAYGAGDSFAAGLTFGLGSGWTSRRRWRWRRAVVRATSPAPVLTRDSRPRRNWACNGDGLPVGRADRDRARRSARCRRRGRWRTPRVLGSGPRHPRWIRGRRDVPLGPRAGADAWPNRLQDGSYEFEGERHQLALDEPENRNAIHGLVRWTGWTVAEREPNRVVMEHVLHPRPGYPFSLALAIEYPLSEEGLVVRTTATNVGSRAVPIRERRASVPDGRHADGGLGRPAASRRERSCKRTSAASLSGDIGVDGTDYDFRRRRPIGTTVLDHCFTDLERDSDGIARVTLQDADAERAHVLGGRALSLPDAVHGRPPARRRPPQPRDRADDLPAERIPDGTGSDPPRGWPVGLLPVGHPPRRR